MGMTTSVLVAQILAFAGLGSNIASVQCKRRIWVLIFQILANVLYGVQYIFLDAWAAFATSMVSAIECAIVYYYANRDPEKPDAKMPLPVMLLIMAVITVTGLWQYAEPMDIIPVAVTALYTWAIWQPNLRIFRISAAIYPVCWFFYNMHVAAWVSMCTAVVEFISAIAAIIRIDILGHQPKAD